MDHKEGLRVLVSELETIVELPLTIIDESAGDTYKISIYYGKDGLISVGQESPYPKELLYRSLYSSTLKYFLRGDGKNLIIK